MEAIEVTAHFDEQGTITPLRFTWKKGDYRVVSTGRRWVDEDGQHFLVMVGDERIYELIYHSGEGLWYLRRTGSERTFA